MTVAPGRIDTGVSLFDSEAGRWLLLSRLPRFRTRRRLAVTEQFGDLPVILELGTATLRAAGLEAVTCEAIAAWQRRDVGHPLVASVRDINSRCQLEGIELMTWADTDYPEPLRHIHDAPLLLYLRGQRRMLGRDQIAVVGSRHASPAGLDHARRFAAALSEHGYLITSGLALGVDGAAHAGALDAGYATVAVIGTGVDVPYPRQHKVLADRIAAEGVLVSELPPGTGPRAAHFPQRNRIISGLSRGILVVEAGLRSGSLITARLALEQGREVFAIPGSVHNPLARGCHQLIRQGAALVESVSDIIEELSGWTAPKAVGGGDRPGRAAAAVPNPVTKSGLPAPLPEGLEPREIAVVEALGYDPRSTDDLCSATGLPADQLMQALLTLELQGLVANVPGGYQRLP